MKAKPFDIPKQTGMEAYKRVTANAGAAGVDKQSVTDFNKNRKDNLYKIWNRMSSGSYFPAPVKAVPIAKKTGGERILGVPTVSDRIAQMVVKLTFEAEVETPYLPDSYGYRPNKSALDAVGITRQRGWRYDWVLEFDIKGLFDNIPHDVLMKAVQKHTECPWVILYIERWLTADMQLPDGEIITRERGTPQGGVVSPVWSNLFLHYVFDQWMQRHYPQTRWCRYADDGLLHCNTEQQAKQMLAELKDRFEACGLELHPLKTKIVYCKDGSRKGDYQNTEFDFLGYTFKRRMCKNRKRNSLFLNFTPAVSKAAVKAMRKETRKRNLRNRTDLSLDDIAQGYNPVLPGWLNYYGAYNRPALYPVWRHVNKTLVSGALRKYKKLNGHKTRAAKFMEEIAARESRLFVHGNKGMLGAFA